MITQELASETFQKCKTENINLHKLLEALQLLAIVERGKNAIDEGKIVDHEVVINQAKERFKKIS